MFTQVLPPLYTFCSHDFITAITVHMQTNAMPQT
jgi:hypothetical protein